MGLMDRFKKGGGFLNNVDGRIVNIRFTTEPDFGNGEATTSKGDFTPLWVELTARVDGSDKDESTHLYAGSADDFVISEDGQTLSPVGDAKDLWGKTAFAFFYESLVANGLPDVDPADDGSLNFSHMIDWRVRFVQVKDEEGMKRAAKNATKSKGKINAEGQRRGKDGKYYDLRTLQVSAVYGQVEKKEVAKVVKGTASTASKAATKSTTKAATKPAPAVDNDISAFAEETLLAILAGAKENTIKKTELNLAVTRKLVKDGRREDVRKFLFDDANLDAFSGTGIISYDKAAQTISLAAAD